MVDCMFLRFWHMSQVLLSRKIVFPTVVGVSIPEEE